MGVSKVFKTSRLPLHSIMDTLKISPRSLEEAKQQVFGLFKGMMGTQGYGQDELNTFWTEGINKMKGLEGQFETMKNTAADAQKKIEELLLKLQNFQKEMTTASIENAKKFLDDLMSKIDEVLSTTAIIQGTDPSSQVEIKAFLMKMKSQLEWAIGTIQNIGN